MKKKIIPFILSTLVLTQSVTSVFANDNSLNNAQLSLETITEKDNTKAENLSLELDTKYNLNGEKSCKNIVSEDKIKVDLPDEKIEFNPKMRIAGSHTPNSAFYIPQELLNQNLKDVVGNEQNWYYFDTTEKTKISLTLQMPENSEYDLRLYKYDNGYLELVSFSEYYGTSEHLSYIAEPGKYFFAILPFTPANNENFLFRIDSTNVYDLSEPDDNIWFAKQYTNKINASQTIDNAFDQDFYKLSVTKSGYTNICLSNITTEKYAVNVYDENLNIIGNFIGDNEFRRVSLPQGNYYIKIQSYDGNFNPNKNYKLNVEQTGSDEYVKLTPKGDVIKFSESKISINEINVPIYWDYQFRSPGYPYYTRTIKLTPLKDGSTNPKIFPGSIQFGTFSGKAGSSNNAIRLALTNVYVYTYLYKTGSSPAIQHIDIKENQPYPLFVIIDANTGKIIDCSLNTAYTDPEEFMHCFKEIKK